VVVAAAVHRKLAHKVTVQVVVKAVTD